MDEIRLEKNARKAIEKLPVKLRQKVAVRLLALRDDPYPSGSKKLQGSKHAFWRLRVGDLRIAYTVAANVITVVIVADRRDVYQRLSRQSK